MIDKDNKKVYFFEIVKMIHPDFNPDIQNPSQKMTEVMVNKDDEGVLYKLGVKWGIIEDDTIEKVDINYVIDRGKLVKINNKYEGIVVDFYKEKGLLKIIVYVQNSFRAFYKKDVNDQDSDFYVIGYADDKEYTNIDFKYQKLYAVPQT